MQRILIFLLLMCCGSCKPSTIENNDSTESSGQGLYPFYQEITSSLDSLFLSKLQNNQYAGAAVNVVFSDGFKYQKTFGFADIQNQKLLGNETLLRVGSLSKSFTGTLCAVLKSKGLLDYNEKVALHIPSLKLSNKDYLESLTLGHLLSHTGGFPYHSYTNLIEAGLEANDIIPYFLTIENLAPPGSLYSYQNAAFNLIGLFLENKLGMSIDEIFKKHLFDPLSMGKSTVKVDEFLSTSNKAFPHQKSLGGWKVKKHNQKYFNAVTAGGIATNVLDMSKFLELLLLEHPGILSKEARTELFEPIIETNVGSRYYTKWSKFQNSYYSYGWRVHTFERNGKVDTLVHHGGFVNNFRSEMAIDTRDSMAVSVIFNCPSPLSSDIIPMILKIVEDKKKPEARSQQVSY